MENRKKILIFNAGPIFPISGMHQVRVYNQINSLSKDHDIDCIFLFTKEHTNKQTQKNLAPFCNEIIPVKTFTQRMLYRSVKKLILNRVFDRLHYPMDYFSSSNIISAKGIAKEVANIPYDIVISHYWQASGFLRYVSPQVFRCIDTHYLVEENLDLYYKGMYGHFDNGSLEKLLTKEYDLQNRCFDHADMLIVNSHAQKKILEKKDHRNVICIPNGQDLDTYLEYQSNGEHTIKHLLFYGSLANQFNQKALRRVIERILPGVKKIKADVKLIIMGSSPPEWIKDLAKESSDIEVTGFVEDVRPVFARCFASVIPLESGSGFRGRTVELLASGVPIVGTTNALQSVQIQHGKNGFIADTDDEMIHCIVQLAEDRELRQRISAAGREFALTNYSLEATFGKLSEYFARDKHYER